MGIIPQNMSWPLTYEHDSSVDVCAKFRGMVTWLSAHRRRRQAVQYVGLVAVYLSTIPNINGCAGEWVREPNILRTPPSSLVLTRFCLAVASTPWASSLWHLFWDALHCCARVFSSSPEPPTPYCWRAPCSRAPCSPKLRQRRTEINQMSHVKSRRRRRRVRSAR